MENEEQNIEQNKELSLQEQLEAQDEFAFLDDDTIQENLDEKSEEEASLFSEETQEEVDNSLDLFETSKELNKEDDIQDEQILQEDEKLTEEVSEDETLEEDFADFSDGEIDGDLIEKPEIELGANISFDDEIEELSKEESNSLITVRPVKFQEFENTPPNRAIKKNLDLIQDVSMHISVELGRTKSSIRKVMELEKASIVELDKIAGEQVEIFVNQKLVAKGEVIVIEDKFGVRVTSTTSPKTE